MVLKKKRIKKVSMKQLFPQNFSDYLLGVFGKVRFSHLLFFFTCCVLGQALFVLLPGLLGIIIDRVFVSNSQNIEALFLFPVIWFFSTILISTSKFLNSNITQDLRMISKNAMFRHLLSMHSYNFIEKEVGVYEHLMQELSFNVRHISADSLPFFVRVITTLVVSLFVISYTSTELVLLFVLWVILFFPLSYIISSKSIKYVSDSLSSSAKVSAATVEVIENHELIPSFDTELFESERFEKATQEEKDTYIKAQFSINKGDFFQRLILLCFPVCISLYLIYFERLAAMSPGTVASIFSFTLILTSQVSDFGRGILGFMEIRERTNVAIQNLLSVSKKNLTYESRGNIKPEKWDIECRDVCFQYGNSNSSIYNINLNIREGEKIGIIGYSGAGKTTLMKLLRGHYAPSKGLIEIGGVPIQSIDPSVLTQMIAEVSQTIPLFHRTIRENVVYGCPGIDDKNLWQVLEKAQIAQLVHQLPQGLDTVIGVKGQILSGGEKARIGIARALIRRSKIIIFDEATAAVDSDSEFLIQAALESLMQERTFIIIAHRLSTLRNIERILVMHEGQIVAEGNENTLSGCEYYNRLKQSQEL